jgi:hypothetical protein
MPHLLHGDLAELQPPVRWRCTRSRVQRVEGIEILQDELMLHLGGGPEEELGFLADGDLIAPRVARHSCPLDQRREGVLRLRVGDRGLAGGPTLGRFPTEAPRAAVAAGFGRRTEKPVLKETRLLSMDRFAAVTRS